MDTMIKAVERIIELEEEGLEDLKDAKGDVVPSEWARVSKVVTAPSMIEGHRCEKVTFHRSLHRKEGQW